jgi:DNA-binding HxlR family transcriptional regulator
MPHQFIRILTELAQRNLIAPEISRAVSREELPDIIPNIVRARLKTLSELGMVEHTGNARPNPASGVRNAEYRITSLGRAWLADQSGQQKKRPR